MRQMRPVPSVLDLIYPPTCGICGKLSQEFLCKNVISYWSNKLNLWYRDMNVWEMRLRLILRNFYMFFKYEGIIRKMLLNYKFQDKSYLYKTFVNFFIK